VSQIPLFQPAPLTISQLNRYVQELLAADDLLRDVWVQGEISNFTRAASGHIYLTLKDGLSTLKSVIWKTSAARVRFPLANGLAVEAHGTVGVYERDGIYQLYIDSIRPAGEGRLYQEFLRLKARLESLGLFDESRKRNLPAFPQRIGLVTSSTGAALQDMLNTFTRRYPLAEVILSPTAVQGEAAPAEIVRAMRKLWTLTPPPDVLIIARGGGSLEDLWAFNDEIVVQAIADSPIPVVTGIGHETDFTLSDFAADRRAPTPTGAAEIVVPDRGDLAAALALLDRRLKMLIRQQLALRQAETSTAVSRLERASPRRRLDSERQHLDSAVDRLSRARDHNMILRQAALAGLHSHLEALNPLAVLRRGYAAVFNLNGLPLTSTAQIEPGQTVRVSLIDGRFDAQVTNVSPKEEYS
jgi:exodeoxyribonuclease VII large subunit